MDWSPQQQQALDDVGRWLKNPGDQQCYRLFGYAGTGKTTLARHLAQGLGNVLFAAYTGKAAYVLQSKGCPGASTLHSLIYQPVDHGTHRVEEIAATLDEVRSELRAEMHAELDPDDMDGHATLEDRIEQNPAVVRLRRELEEAKSESGGLSFSLKLDSPLRQADLLVVDECSMVGREMAEDLLSFGTPILVLGDPAQLPPVKSTGYFTDAKPDFLLTEIHRQASDNPIIALATQVRKGQALKAGRYGDSLVLYRRDATEALYRDHDQMLVGTNKIRRGVNRKFRELLGLDPKHNPYPVATDKLICLKNDKEEGLLNGTLWTVREAAQEVDDRLLLEVESVDEGHAKTLQAHSHYFRGEEPPYYEIREAACFDYGYAITCHKSQGSQWSSVLVLDESGAFRQDAAKWLYTAITRAADRVTVVL